MQELEKYTAELYYDLIFSFGVCIYICLCAYEHTYTHTRADQPIHGSYVEGQEQRNWQR